MKLLKRFVWKISFILLVGLLILYLFRFSKSYFSEAMEVYTKSTVISYATEVIDEALREGVVELLDGNSLLKETYDSNGKVAYAYLDVKVVNHLRNNISKYISQSIKIINESKTFKTIELPVGYFFGLHYFYSKGIRIPIKLEVIGDQQIQIEKNIESYGLNTTVLQIDMKVALNIRSVIPFQTKVIETAIAVPVALEILNNDIPYYLGNRTKN